MKKSIIMTALCAALAFAGCTKEEATDAQKGGVVRTTITVGTEAATKASADNDGAAAAVKRCIVQVRMGDKVYETKTIEGTEGQKSYTASIDLINGQAYTILAWVDAGDDIYNFDEPTAKVTRVALTAPMDEKLDAFYGTATLNLAETQNAQVSISAKRPLAQINLISTDTFKAGFEPTNLVVTTKAAETFNVLNGTFSGEKEYTATSDAAYTSKTLAMTYVFASAEKSIIDVKLSATFNSAFERSFTNIPVQQNYRTNISGKFFTVGSGISVDVDPDWDGDNHTAFVANNADLATAISAAAAGTVISITAPGTYTLPDIANNITINGADGVIVDATGSGSICSIPNGCTFNKVEFNFGTNDYHGFQHAGTINMNSCKLNGKFFSYADMNFSSCVFTQTAEDYSMWCYAGNLTYTNCSFTGKGKFLNIYNEGGATPYTITANACTFTSSVANKAAFNVKETSGSTMLKYNVVISSCTTQGEFPAKAEFDETKTLYVIDPLVQVDDRNVSATETGISVTLDGNVVYPVAAASN